jgi:hypothetical protein
VLTIDNHFLEPLLKVVHLTHQSLLEHFAEALSASELLLVQSVTALVCSTSTVTGLRCFVWPEKRVSGLGGWKVKQLTPQLGNSLAFLGENPLHRGVIEDSTSYVNRSSTRL